MTLYRHTFSDPSEQLDESSLEVLRRVATTVLRQNLRYGDSEQEIARQLLAGRFGEPLFAVASQCEFGPQYIKVRVDNWRQPHARTLLYFPLSPNVGHFKVNCCYGSHVCEHVSAAALIIRDASQGWCDPIVAWTEWAAAHNTVEMAPPRPPEQFLDSVWIDLKQTQGRNLSFSLLADRPNANGKSRINAKTVKLTQQGRLTPDLSPAIPSTIVALIASLARQGSSEVVVNSDVDAMAIQTLIEQGYARTGETRLKWGTPASLKPGLTESRRDPTKLTVMWTYSHPTEEDLAIIDIGSRMWYLTPGGTIGEIAAPPGYRTVDSLPPPISRKYADRLMQVLASKAPTIELPLRDAGAGQISVKPRLHLTLKSNRIGARGRRKAQTLPMLSVELQYGPYRLPLSGTETESVVGAETGGEVTVLRDLSLEARLERNLSAAGIVRGADGAPGSFQVATPSGGDARRLHAVAAALAKDNGGTVDQRPDYPYQVVETEDITYSDDVLDGPWLSIGAKVRIGEHLVDFLPALKALLTNNPDFTLRPKPGEPEGAMVEIPVSDELTVRMSVAKVRQMTEPIADLIEASTGNTIRLSRAAATILSMVPDSPPMWAVQHTADAMKAKWDARTLRALPMPLDFEPWVHQVEGYQWLGWLGACGIGGVLADQQGVGKTRQVLLDAYGRKLEDLAAGLTLVVCSKTARVVWEREIRKQVPQLSYRQFRAGFRGTPAEQIEMLSRYDVLICTYQQLVDNIELFKQIRIELVAIDEASNAKNYKSQIAGAVRQLPARILPITGTPVENNVWELFTLVDLAAPGLLGTRASFQRNFATPIANGDQEARLRLRRRVAPLILRRLKSQVFKDQPPKRYLVHPVSLGPQQRALYESLRAAASSEVRQMLKESHGSVAFNALNMLTRMRQACCSPKLLPQIGLATRTTESAKEESYEELLAGYLASGKKVVVSAYWSSMLDLLQQRTDRMGIPSFRIDGDTSETQRRDQEDRFQGGEGTLFYISMKAGGYSITLNEADVVLIFTPWWNPKAEEQVEDRVHRGDITKQIDIVRIVVAGSVEERIIDMQADKNALASDVLGDDERVARPDGTPSSSSPTLTEEDLLALLSPIPEEDVLGGEPE